MRCHFPPSFVFYSSLGTSAIPMGAHYEAFKYSQIEYYFMGFPTHTTKLREFIDWSIQFPCGM